MRKDDTSDSATGRTPLSVGMSQVHFASASNYDHVCFPKNSACGEHDIWEPGASDLSLSPMERHLRHDLGGTLKLEGVLNRYTMAR
jgi:hypothetical protein